MNIIGEGVVVDIMKNIDKYVFIPSYPTYSFYVRTYNLPLRNLEDTDINFLIEETYSHMILHNLQMITILDNK